MTIVNGVVYAVLAGDWVLLRGDPSGRELVDLPWPGWGQRMVTDVGPYRGDSLFVVTREGVGGSRVSTVAVMEAGGGGRAFDLPVQGTRTEPTPLSNGEWILPLVVQTGRIAPIVEDSASVLKLGREGSILDVIRTIPWMSRYDWDGRFISGVLSPHGALRTHDDQVLAFWPSESSLAVWGADGAVVRVVRWPGERRDVTVEVLDTLELRIVNASGTRSAAEVARTRTRFQRVGKLPAYSTLVPSPPIVDDCGRIWIPEYTLPGGKASKWDVMSIEGASLGTVLAPQGLALYDVREGRAVGLVGDGGEASIVLHRVNGGGRCGLVGQG